MLVAGTGAVNFEIHNQCTYKIWVASLNPGGGQALDSGQSWTLGVAAGQQAGRIWGQTSCSFGTDEKGSCKTSNCGGLLTCQGSSAVPAALCTNITCNNDINNNCPTELKVDEGCKNSNGYANFFKRKCPI
eukprot:Gb_19749 [translate_table: standard]